MIDPAPFASGASLGQLPNSSADSQAAAGTGQASGAPGRAGRVLICGGATATGRMLVDSLRAAGTPVCVYEDAKPGSGSEESSAEYRYVRGGLDRIHLSPDLMGEFAAAVSLLSVAPMADSGEFDRLSSLVRFCRERGVRRLVHVEPVLRPPGAPSPTRRVVENAPKDLSIHVVRVGVLLGGLLEDPMVGIGVRLWNNRLLALGSLGDRVPVSSSRAVVETIVGLLASGGATEINRVDEASPTRREYLDACCQQLGAGMGVRGTPGWLWPVVSGLGWVASKLGSGRLEPWRVAEGAVQPGPGLRGFDWVRELTETVENQKPNFKSPHTTASPTSVAAPRVNFIGPGAMDGGRMLLALRKLGHQGRVVAHGDPEGGGKWGAESRALEGVEAADLHVLPPLGASEVKRLEGVSGAVLVGRPVCGNEGGWRDLVASSLSRGGGVYALHEHRFRGNVTRLLEHLRRFNPGGLIHVDVDLQVPGTERGDLCELALPCLDLAMMFHSADAGLWELGPVRSRRDRLGVLDLVRGEFQSRTCSVGYVLRRGFVARRTVIRYTFQNYRALLTFGPDNFFPQHAADPWGLSSLGLRERLRGAIDAAGSAASSDDVGPTALAICAALGDLRLSPSIELARLEPFYRAWFALRRAVEA